MRVPRVIAQELSQLFGPVQGGPAAAGAAPSAAGAVRFLPIDRLRAVLAIAGDASLIDEAKTWVERLDRGQEGDGRRVYVYRVQNGRAADLGRVLGQLFPATVTPVGREGPTAALAPGLNPTESGFGLNSNPNQPQQPGSAENASAENALGDGANAGVVGTGDSAFDYTGTDLALSVAGAQQQRRTGIQIVPDVRNNALVVSATPEEYRQIEGALQQLDVTPLQVLIEATIAEVTLTDQLRYGLEWFFHTGDSNFSFSSLATGAVSPAFPGFSYAFSSANAQVVLNALSQITDVKVISSPQLMVLNNETARLPSRRSGADRHAGGAVGGEYRCADRQLDRVPGHRCDPQCLAARELGRAGGPRHRAGGQRCCADHHLGSELSDHSAAPE